MNREEIAQAEVGHTDIGPVSARVLAVLFVLTLVLVPAAQLLVWVTSGFSPAANVHFPMLRSLALPTRAVRGATEIQGPLWTKLKAGNRAMLREIESIEDDLVDVSIVGEVFRPRVQEALVRVGWGTEQVRIGREGWLFFEPAVQYLTGKGFLDLEQQAKRVQATASWLDPPSVNPVPAIIDFANQLDDRGIELVLVPVPVKAGVVPDKLSRRLQRGGVLHNESWTTFLTQLERAGVRVESVDETLQELNSVFLKTDTHWTWQAVDAVAQHLAERLRTSGVKATSNFKQKSAVASNPGDLSQMLPLLNTSLFPEETADMLSVVDLNSDHSPTRAPVLLLGDSFSNIYSDNTLGWGSFSGLPERLAWHLQTPVASIIRNNDGAFATRLELARRLAQNPDSLHGVRYVVWEFTERELSFGDWRTLDLGQTDGGVSTFLELRPGERKRIRAVIAKMGEIPIPDEAAYPDYLIGLHLVGIQLDDESIQTEALVFIWAMRNYELTPNAHLQVGDQIMIAVRPWSDVSGDLDTITRGEIFDERLLTQIPCWGEVVSE